MKSRLMVLALLAGAPLGRAAELLADVLVYGSTPAGCCAAVAAAREGASVILLAPDQHLGGMLTSGQCAIDPRPIRDGVLAGLVWEWHWRVEQDYRQRDMDPGYRVEKQDDAVSWVWEPHAALRVTRQMLDEAGVLVLAGRRLRVAALDGPRLLRLHTGSGDFKAKVFIDATYEGDLAALCGVRFQAEAEEDAEPALVDGADAALPTVESERASEALPFLLCLTESGNGRTPLPDPAPSHDPLLLDDVRHWLGAHPQAAPVWFEQSLPNGKMELRFDLSGPLAGFFTPRGLWCSADAEGRAQLWEQQRQRVLLLCRFLADDPAVPEAWRQRWSALGLARDEFTGNAHWPPLLPLRAGRRVQGHPIWSVRTVLADGAEEATAALCPFPVADDAPAAEWPVPLRALLPAMEECENLLVPAAPSCAPGMAAALWHESMQMALGQGAGIAAALASRDDEVLPLHALDPAALRVRLAAQGVVLHPPARAAPKPALAPAAAAAVDAAPPGLVLDDSEAELHGPWRFSRHTRPYHGGGYHHDGRQGEADCSAVFRFQVPESGRYELRLAYTPDADRASNVPITIEAAGRKARLAFDQTQPHGPDAPFRRLAEVILPAGEPVILTISNQGADGMVIVDGLQVLKTKTSSSEEDSPGPED